MLSERPANSTAGYMTINPSTPNADFISRERGQESAQQERIPDFTIGENPSNAVESYDTSGLFLADGTVRTATPPGDNSYVLGPMSAMWYSWANQTRIGYIRQSDRKMQNLGYISGRLGAWDGGSSGFNSYGQLTLEQAQWFRTIGKKDGADNNTENYRAYYPGPPSNAADSFGRYSAVVVGAAAGNELSGIREPQVNAGTSGEQDSDSTYSAIMNQLMNNKPRLSDFGSGRAGRAAYNRALREWQAKLDAAAKEAGLETENPIFNQDNWETVKDAASKFANTLWQGAKLVTGAKAAEIIADLTLNPLVDAAFGQSVADSASDYNKKLATSLATSVVTGKPHRIILSKQGKKDLINSIDLDMLRKHMTVGPTPDPTADNAVNPGKGKQNGLLKGAWGNQGGTHINYDVDNGKFTITSVKMLRDFGDLDEKDAGGKITNFNDIPNPSLDDVKRIFKQKGMEGPLKKFYNTISSLEISSSTDDKKFRPFAAGYDPDQAAEMMYDGFGNITKALYNFTMEGSASNAVHLRNQLIKAGVNKSEIEKMGAGFGGYVYSQAEYLGSDIPGGVTSGVRGVVTSKAHKHLGITMESKKILSESRKADIIRDLKKPVVIPETKQKSYKVKPKIRGLENNAIVSKPVATPEEYKPPMKMWGRYEYNQNVRASQERKNEVLNLLGEGEAAMQYRLKNGTTRSEQEMKKFWGKHPELYDFYFNNMSHRMLRKEQVEGGDFVVFLLAENGKKVSMSQSKLNEKLAEAEDQKLLDEYNKLNPKSEPISYEKDPLFKKVSSKLKPVINYPKKPAVKGYPDKAPPKLVNGFHPDLGKRYKYDKLDPQSAEAMPPQGNPEIDANIEKFTDKNAKIRKIKNLIGKKS